MARPVAQNKVSVGRLAGKRDANEVAEDRRWCSLQAAACVALVVLFTRPLLGILGIA